MMNDEFWQAILACDASYDGSFFYGVRTTGVYCRPSCKSKNPKRENARIFATANEAAASGFRPCKRCRPDAVKWPDEEVTAGVKRIIERRYHEPLTLSSLALELHISPYHLHRVFKRMAGRTPNDYLRDTRMDAAQKLLEGTDTSMAEIALKVGMPNAAHFSTVFQKHFGIAPSAFRNRMRYLS